MDYADIEEGDVIAERTFHVCGSGMKIVSALMRDPNPIHYDRKTVEERGYPGLVNQGPINVSYIVQTILSILDTPKDLVSMRIRFVEMVFEKETVTVRCKVENKPITADDNQLDLEVLLEKEDGTVGASGMATVRMS